MSRLAKHFLMLLAVLAVGTAQVFGIARGFVCVCSGEPVPVESALCETSHCHPGHEHHDHDDHDCPGEEPEEHHHREVTESILLVTPGPLTFDLPMIVECDLSEVIARCVQLSRENAEHEAELLRPPDDTGDSPPAALMVAKTMVMLV